jgi:hypothetical protein
MQTPTQHLFKGNVITVIENVTGGYIWTDEGRVHITQECTFTVIQKNLRFGVEVHHVEDDHDMYAISVYDQSSPHDRYRREDDNEICYCYMDSTGGSSADEILDIGNPDVEDAIMGTLFGREDLGILPLIKAF